MSYFKFGRDQFEYLCRIRILNVSTVVCGFNVILIDFFGSHTEFLPLSADSDCLLVKRIYVSYIVEFETFLEYVLKKFCFVYDKFKVIRILLLNKAK